MSLYLIHDGIVHAEATDADRALGVFDIRDLSAVAGIAIGWIAKADGTYTAPPAPALPVPNEVSNFQGHAALLAEGLDDAAQTAITAIADPVQRKMAQLAFDKGAFLRNSPLVLQLAAALNLTSDKIDDLFRSASKISA